MAKNTTIKIKDLNPARKTMCGAYSRFDEYFNLLMNSVKVVRKSSQEKINYEVETFLKKTLFENGSVGYDKMLDKFFYVFGEQVNDYGNPTNLILRTANGRTFSRKASYENEEDGAYKIDALPIPISLSEMIKVTTDFMTNCEVAMKQNLEACKTPYIVVCKNKDLQLSYEHALQEKQEGQAVILVSEELGDGLKSIDVSVAYLVDKFAEARDTERDTLLNKLGIMTANTDKKERIQSAEVNATIGQATDYIYLLIDTFNAQTTTYGIDYEMQLNGSLEEIYLDEDGVDEVDHTNDVERN